MSLTPRRASADARLITPKEELQRMYLLRKDLERCRILLELIKKREQIKLDLVHLIHDEFEVEIDPLKAYL